MARASFRPGEIVAKFQIDRLIGKGSMGAVYAAWDVSLERDVAVKFMLPDMVDDPTFCERFLGEARAAGGIECPNVTRVYEVGTLPIGLPYIVMELLQGESLDRVLADRKPQAVNVAVDYILQTCRALAETHARGIVHRDLKPANLFVDRRTRKPVIKVLDFGIARLPARGDGARLTLPNQVLGTPLYMAPEQWSAASDVDHLADIFAVGVILYELLVGRAPSEVNASKLPYVSTEAAAIPRPIRSGRSPGEPLVPPHKIRAEIPPALSDVVARCLEVDPKQRFPDVSALAHALAPFAVNSDVELPSAIKEALASRRPQALVSRSDAPPFSLQPSEIEASGEHHTQPVPISRQPQAYTLNLATQSKLLSALNYHAQRARPITFLVGSGLTAPYAGRPGVPSVDGMIQLVRSRYKGEERLEFDHEIRHAANRYQEAFAYLLATRGADGVNQVIREAVLQARIAPAPAEVLRGDRLACRALEQDLAGWVTLPALEGLGGLIARFPAVFGEVVLTSNFDPLIEIAIKRAGGVASRTVLHGDGAFQLDAYEGCHVIHFHGDWFRADTLHTPNQLSQPRPKLTGSLTKLLNERTLVVLGYGGWGDVFTRGLIDAVARGGDGLDVLWAFYSSDRTYIERKYGQLFEELREAMTRGRVNFYLGVDAHTTLTELLERLTGPKVEPHAIRPPGLDSHVRKTSSETLVSGAAEAAPQRESMTETLLSEVEVEAETETGHGEADERPTFVYSKR